MPRTLIDPLSARPPPASRVSLADGAAPSAPLPGGRDPLAGDGDDVRGANDLEALVDEPAADFSEGVAVQVRRRQPFRRDQPEMKRVEAPETTERASEVDGRRHMRVVAEAEPGAGAAH